MVKKSAIFYKLFVKIGHKIRIDLVTIYGDLIVRKWVTIRNIKIKVG